MPRHRSTGPRRPSSTARWLTGALVAVIAVGVIVLVVLALSHARGDAVVGTPRPVPTFTAPPTASPTPTPTAAPTVAAPGAAERFLAVGTGAVWRATAGECGVTAPVVERSTDDGATWTDVTPAYRGIGQVLSLDPLAGDQAEMVARMGASCEVQALRTFTYGRFWEPYPDVLAASTYLDPLDPATVVTPRGRIPAPCAEAWGLRAAGGSVGLVCDSTAYELSNGQWTALGADAVAVAIDDGVVVPVSSAQAPSPAAAAIDDGLLVWTGDTLTRLDR